MSFMGPGGLCGVGANEEPRPCRPDAMVLAVRPIERADVDAFAARVRGILEANDAPAVMCDVRELTLPDLVMVDALTRLVLIGRQLGRSVEFRHVSPGLRGLFDLVGLSEVVCEEGQGDGPRSGVEDGGEPPEGEE